MCIVEKLCLRQQSEAHQICYCLGTLFLSLPTFTGQC